MVEEWALYRLRFAPLCSSHRDHPLRAVAYRWRHWPATGHTSTRSFCVACLRDAGKQPFNGEVIDRRSA